MQGPPETRNDPTALERHRAEDVVIRGKVSDSCDGRAEPLLRQGRSLRRRSFELLVHVEDGPRLRVSGRVGWTLQKLIEAGPRGISSLDCAALRLASYVLSLRKLGVTITTEHEPHGGHFPGRHARYRLTSHVILVDEAHR